MSKLSGSLVAGAVLMSAIGGASPASADLRLPIQPKVPPLWGGSAVDCTDAVNVEGGKVSGRYDDNGVCAYQGIPYAKPPVDHLRWQPAQKPVIDEETYPEVTEGVYPAVNDDVRCMQPEVNRFGIAVPSGTEDCLHLNVWRPVDSGLMSGARPVMVWFHGGGNQVGSGFDAKFDGAKLAASEDVMVVSVNYRLGVFGFYGPGDSVFNMDGYFAPNELGFMEGNYGLVDQLSALQWVQSWIGNFGGDPNNVTVFGSSAGANDICALWSSPLSEGLFDKVILQSGGCKPISSTEQASDLAAEIESAAGCSGGASSDPMGRFKTTACMRNMDADDLLEDTMHRHLDFLSAQWLSNNNVRFKPYVDGRVLPQQPVSVVAEGILRPLPVLGGTNESEHTFFFVFTDDDLEPEEYLDVHFPEMDLTYEAFKAEYGIGDADDPDTIRAKVQEAWGDYHVDCAAMRTLDSVALSQHGTPFSTYQYRFAFDGHNFPETFGATHGLEVGFVFDRLAEVEDSMSVGPVGLRFDDEAQDLVPYLQAYWANFARTGNPNSEALPVWPAYSRDTASAFKLDLGEGALQPTDLQDQLKHCDFWQAVDTATVN